MNKYIQLCTKGLAITVTFLLITSFLGFSVAIRPPRIRSSATPDQHGLEYENVEFTTQDGIRLTGWFIPSHTSDTTKTVIGLHGYPADKGDILPIFVPLAKDFNIFLFDFRYFGGSEGTYSTVGARETLDLHAAVEYVKSKNQDRIGVWGYSMGGAVALMGHTDIPDINAIASHSAYADLASLATELYRIPVLDRLLAELTLLWARITIRENVRTVRPTQRVTNSTLPIMLSHSKTDEVIPFDHALKLQDALRANENAVFWFQDDVSHGQIPEAYREAVRQFFLEHL